MVQRHASELMRDEWRIIDERAKQGCEHSLSRMMTPHATCSTYLYSYFQKKLYPVPCGSVTHSPPQTEDSAFSLRIQSVLVNLPRYSTLLTLPLIHLVTVKHIASHDREASDTQILR